MATKVTIPNPLDVVTGGIDAFDNLAGWIANPPADKPLAAAIGRSGQLVCDFYGATPNPARLIFGTANPAIGLLCKPYYANNGYDGPVPGSPPFTGGQCSTTYIARYNDGTGIAAIPPGGITGPITEFFQTLLTPLGSGPGGTAVFRVTCKNASGQIQTDVGTFNAAGFVLSLVRADSGSDNCGNPPGGAPVPGANPPPTPPAFPSGEEPGVDPDGQPFFFVPPIEPEIPGDDPVPVPAPTEPGGDSPSEPPADGGEEEGVGSGDEGGDTPFDEPPEGERWVGCCVTLDFEESRVGVIPASLPDPVYPRVVGNARLLFGGGGTDTPVRITSRNFCLWEPVRGLSPTGVRVSLLPDISYTVRKYSVPLEN